MIKQTQLTATLALLRDINSACLEMILQSVGAVIPHRQIHHPQNIAIHHGNIVQLVPPSQTRFFNLSFAQQVRDGVPLDKPKSTLMFPRKVKYTKEAMTGEQMFHMQTQLILDANMWLKEILDSQAEAQQDSYLFN